MNILSWSILIDSLWDAGRLRRGVPDAHRLPGPSLPEWLGIVQKDFDEVDRLYLDSDTLGGE